MIYELNELLAKMGAPEVREKNRIEWHYFDRERTDLAGYAEVRLEAGGRRLVAELKHVRADYEDDHGDMHDTFTESFHMLAERQADGKYKVVKMGFDGADYEEPQKAVIELGLSIFHSRALDISILMVEQTFNRQDITAPAEEKARPAPLPARAIFAREKTGEIRQEKFGVVIPFRQRQIKPEAYALPSV